MKIVRLIRNLPTMLFSLAADLLVLAHFGFIVFVVAGGSLAFRWPRVIWVHLPAVVWGVTIEFAGFICPLTPLENKLRFAAGESGYTGGFIDQYVVPIVYPSGLSRNLQIILGVTAILINVAIYAALLAKRKQNREAR